MFYCLIVSLHFVKHFVFIAVKDVISNAFSIIIIIIIVQVVLFTLVLLAQGRRLIQMNEHMLLYADDGL